MNQSTWTAKHAKSLHSTSRMICRLIYTSLLLGSVSAVNAAQPADQILISDHVVTMARNQPAQPLAVAIRDGKISWIGSHDQYQVHADKDTQIIQLGSKALLPGFIDAHGHTSYLALSTTTANVASPPVGPVENMEDLQDVLTAFIKDRKIAKDEWVIGLGYDDSLVSEQRHPTKVDLDAVSEQHPILLIHVSGHLAAANSRALARGGISSETPNPPGGIIRRMPNSQEPNGVLEESATYPLRKYMNAANKDPLASVATAMEIYASNGITTAQDGGASSEVVELLQSANKAGKLNLDVIAYATGMQDEHLIARKYEYGEYSGRFKVGGIKLMLDGSPQGKTAFLTKPYFHPPHGQDEKYVGYPSVPPARVTDLVATYLNAGVPIIAHANGDAAADMLINAVADAAPKSDHRTVMIHAQTVREDQLTQMKNLKMVPSYFSAHTFYWGDWHRDSVFGVERASRISPTASTVARGMPFTVHNDAPIVPPDMIRLLWATTNRITRSGKTLGADQRVSIYDGLRGMTIYAAYQNFEESIKGSIEVGKQADLVVLSEDPLAMNTIDLLNLKVEQTYSKGNLIFDRAAQ